MFAKDNDFWKEMTEKPAEFCPNVCKRAAVIDVMSINPVEPGKPDMVSMIKGMLNFLCLKRDADNYCLPVIQNQVEIKGALNYDLTEMTKPKCEKPEEKHSGGRRLE